MIVKKKNILQFFLFVLIFLFCSGWALAQISDDVDVSGTAPELPGPSEPPSSPVTAEGLTLYSSTHPNQSQWYSNNNPKFIWNTPNHPTGYSYIFDQKAETVPDNISEGLAKEKTYSGIADGVWYFHLKALGNSFSPPVLHWKTNIDVTPPEFEYLRFQEGYSTTNRRPTLEFNAADVTSGVDYYEYKLLESSFQKISSPHQVEKLEPRIHTAEVKSYDRAGNFALGKTKIEILALASPRITDLTRVVSLFQNVKIWGTGPKNSQIILFVTPEANTKSVLKWKTKTDEKGKWQYTYRDFLNMGKYEVYAKAYDNAGGESEKSNTEDFLVSIKGIAMFGIIVPIWAIILVVALLLILFRFLAPYLLILIPWEKKRILTLALLREGEVLLLEKKRELSTEKPIFEFPAGNLKAFETAEKAALRISQEYFSGVETKIIKKLNFSLEISGKPRAASLIILQLISGEPEIHKEHGYIGHWWVNLEENAEEYFTNIPDGFQKQTLVELQKYLARKNQE